MSVWPVYIVHSNTLNCNDACICWWDLRVLKHIPITCALLFIDIKQVVCRLQEDNVVVSLICQVCIKIITQLAQLVNCNSVITLTLFNVVQVSYLTNSHALHKPPGILEFHHGKQTQ